LQFGTEAVNMVTLLSQTDPLTLNALLTHVGTLGSTGIVVIGFWLLYTGKLVTRRELDKVEAEKQEWKNTAITAYKNNSALQTLTDRTVTSLEKLAETADTAMHKPKEQ
jgi:molybdopterin-guanine dinucleotide biosynthesis protein